MKDTKTTACAGFTAAPSGWRVAYRPAPGDRSGLVLPMAGWMAIEPPYPEGTSPLVLPRMRLEMVAAVHHGATLIRADRLPGHEFWKVLAPHQGAPGPTPPKETAP